MNGLRRPWRDVGWASRLAPLWICVFWTVWLTTRRGFDSLDYHACLALAPVIALAAGLLSITTLRRNVSESGGRALWRLWPVAAAMLMPLAIMTFNGLFVPNCAPGTGLVIYLLGPVFSAAVAVAMATLCLSLAPARPRLTFLILALASCLPALWHFLSQPQVTAYAPLVGYIVGPLYEDVIEPEWPWLSFRALDVALWLSLVAASRAASSTSARLAVAVAATAAVVGLIRAPLDGWRVDSETVERTLSIEVSVDIPTPADALPRSAASTSAPTPALVLHMPPGGERSWLRSAAVADAREAYVRLWLFFGQPAGRTVELYLYPDVLTKHRLMGARNVEMAKPWLSQAHMVLPAPGGTTMRHELAHVFAARLGRWPFGVPMRGGWLPDALLIEGVAVAAEWPRRGGLDPHGQTRAMRRLKLAPPLQTLLTPTGFFGQSSARAYTMAGSFVRWLVDHHGPQVLEALYFNGDIEAAAETPLHQLIASWEAFVDSDAAALLTDRHVERARARFEPGGLFQRPCLVEIGRCRARAGRAFMAGNVGVERGLREELMSTLAPHLGDRPLGPDLTVALTGSRARAGDHEAALAALDSILQAPAAATLSRLRRAGLLRARGDVRLRGGDRPCAQRDWSAAANLPLSDAGLRTLVVRQHLSATPEGRIWLENWLLLGRPAGRWLTAIEELVPLASRDPVAAYLHARYTLLRDRSEAPSIRLRELAPTLSQRFPLLAIEAWRLVAFRAARRGQCGPMRRAMQRARKAGGAQTSAWRHELAQACATRAWLATQASLVSP